MAVENGLSQLSARQERRRRQPLPPRFPKSEPEQRDGEQEPVTQPHTETPTTGRPTVQELRAEPLSQQASAPPHPEPSIRQPAALSPLRAAQHYIDDETDQALRACRAAGIVRRVDVTNSAVVRLAVQRLVDELHADGVVDLLSAEPGDRARTGRKRR